MRHTGADLDILRDLANYRSHGSVSQSLVAGPSDAFASAWTALSTEAVIGRRPAVFSALCIYRLA